MGPVQGKLTKQILQIKLHTIPQDKLYKSSQDTSFDRANSRKLEENMELRRLICRS